MRRPITLHYVNLGGERRPPPGVPGGTPQERLGPLAALGQTLPKNPDGTPVPKSPTSLSQVRSKPSASYAQGAPRANSSGPDLYLERGTHVLDDAERRPLLYDAKGRGLVREVGFRA